VLHFAEIFWGAAGDGAAFGGAGQRVFDVTVEGILVADDLDLFDTVGAESAIALTIPVSVLDGELNINFTASVDAAKVSAIQVRALDTTSGPDCLLPTNVTVNATATQAIFNWDAVAGAMGYQLGGRRAGLGSFRYTLSATNSKLVSGLKPGRSYEYILRAKCAADTSAFTEVDTFTTLTSRSADSQLLALELFPNPASDQVQVIVSATADDALTWQVIDLQGRQLLAGQQAGQAGRQTLVLDLYTIEPGMYWVSVRQGDRIQVLPLTILR